MAGGQFGGGTGTAAAPYLVEDAFDLNQVRVYPDAYFKLTSNINLGVPPYNTAKGWAPIPNFTGQFDGNSKTIYNLFINRPDEDYVGLFKQISHANIAAVAKLNVKDLGLANVDILGRDYVGAFVGDISLADIRSNMNSEAYTSFNRCYVTGTIKGRSYVGGLCGRFYWGSATYPFYIDVLRDCYANVTIQPQPGGSYYGIMIGQVRDYWMNGNYNYFSFYNSIAIGKLDTSLVAAPINIGIVCWHNQNANLNATTCRYDKTTWISTFTSPNISVGLTTGQMQDAANFTTILSGRNLNSIPIWSLLEGRYPELYHQSMDYLFISCDDGYYIYNPVMNKWEKKFTTVPTRQQAIESGMKHLEYIPQSAWDILKSQSNPQIINIMDKADQTSIYASSFNFAKDTANSNSEKTIFRKEMVFSSFGGSLATINI
jgi:hypothetical protein